MMKCQYKPEDMTRDNFHRSIFFWFSRVDVKAANIISKEPLLEQEWYDTMEDSIRADIQRNPTDLESKEALCSLMFHRAGRNLAILSSESLHDPTSATSFDDTAAISDIEPQTQLLMSEIDDLLREIADSKAAIAELPKPTLPGALVETRNSDTAESQFIQTVKSRIGLKELRLLLLCHTGNILRNVNRDELTNLALELRQEIEAICRCAHRSEDGLQSLQQSLAICATFLPVEEPHITWSRRMMAIAESQGYILQSPTREVSFFSMLTCLSFFV